MIPYALPPAETKLSWRTLAHGYLGKSDIFAETLSAYFGTKSCVLSGNARSLLFLLLGHLHRDAGPNKTEVLIPGYTCYSVPAAVVKAGFRVALYDINPVTLQPDMDDVARKINPKTLAVVGQHFLGIRSDIASLTRMANRESICCIEDSAQLLQSTMDTMDHVKNADFSIFSFGRGKPLPLGQGGALIAANTEVLTSIAADIGTRSQKSGNYLMPLAIRAFSNPRLYWMLEKLPLGLGRTVYDPGFAVSPMPQFYQRSGVKALGELETMNKHRLFISRVYADHLCKKTGSLPGNRGSIPLRYPLLLKNRLVLHRFFDFGVRRLYPLALCDLPPLQTHMAQKKMDTPGARSIAEQLITLPTHSAITESTAARLASDVEKFISS